MKPHSYIAILLFSTALLSCSKNVRIAGMMGTNIEINSNINDDAQLESKIIPYREELKSTMDEVLCSSSQDLIKGRPESELGNLMADLTLEIGKELYGEFEGEGIDICLLNTGGLRASLPKGDITRGHIFSLMPFENELVVVTLSSNGLAEMLEYIKEKGGEPISGLKADLGQTPYEVLINDIEMDPSKNYKVITTDYLANGGDKMSFLTEGSRLNIEVLDMKMRDAILLYCERQGKMNKPLKSQLDGRLKI